MVSLVVVLLAATPGQASLVSPVESSVRPSARLLAQSKSETNSEASPPPLVPASDARIRERTLRVEEINDRLRALNTDWPMGSVVMVYTGYVLSPLLLLGIPLMIAGIGNTEFGATLIAIGKVLTIMGGVGVALAVAGIVTGINAAKGPRAERQALIQERTRLEDELRTLKRRGDAALHRGRPDMPARSVVTASFSF